MLNTKSRLLRPFAYTPYTPYTPYNYSVHASKHARSLALLQALARNRLLFGVFARNKNLLAVDLFLSNMTSGELFLQVKHIKTQKSHPLLAVAHVRRGWHWGGAYR